MGARSAIDLLPPEIRAAVHDAIRDGAMIDEIVARIRDLGGDVSRSAVGRYRKKALDLVKRQREADRISEIWVRELGERPEGKTGRLAIETLRTLAMHAAVDLGDREGDIDPDEIGTLALAIRRIESAGKLSTERELAIRREAAGRADEAARRAGLPADVAAAIRSAIEGEEAPAPGSASGTGRGPGQAA